MVFENRHASSSIRQTPPVTREVHSVQLSASRPDEVAELFRRLGYRVKITGGRGDQGIDLRVDEDTIVQCKAYAGRVGPAPVRELLGARTHSKAKRAILVARGGSSAEAERFAASVGIEIWDVGALVTLHRSTRH